MPQRVMPVTIIPSSPTPHTLPIRRIACLPCGRHSTAWRVWDTWIVQGNLPEIGPALVQGPPRAARHELVWLLPLHLDTGTRLVDEDQSLAALHVYHPALEHLDA